MLRKAWLLVLLLAIVTGVVLVFTWHHIPVLNTWLVSTGIPDQVDGAFAEISGGIMGLNPGALLTGVIALSGVLVTVVTKAIGALRSQGNQLTGLAQHYHALQEEAPLQLQALKDQLLGDFDAERTQWTAEKQGFLSQIAALQSEKQQLVGVQTKYAQLQENYAALLIQNGELEKTAIQLRKQTTH